MPDSSNAPTARMPSVPTDGDSGATPATKPGFQTSEFWLSTAATVGGILLASGAIADGSVAAQVVGGVLSLLASLGYTASRTALKRPAP